VAIPYGESKYLYGIHDPGGEHLMMVNGKAKGWVLFTEEIRANPNDQGGGNYKDFADKGYGVIVRLNHAYGSDGTIPHSSKYRDFAQRVANFVSNSQGAHIWILGNEMNFEREQPRQPGTSQAEPIIPRRYADCYRMCHQAVHSLPGHENDQLLVGAPAPWNAETPYDADPQGAYTANRIPGPPGGYGDFVKYLTDICLAIGANNCDGFAIHAYTHGVEPSLVFSDAKMGPPFQQYHYHFRTYRDFMNAIPQNMRHLPVYITEADEDDPWQDANRGWIQNAYKEISEWNEAGNQLIRAVILYRWPKADQWNMDGKLGVQDDFRQALAKNYEWHDKYTKKSTGGIGIAMTQFDYRTNFINHNTPTTLPPGQTLAVSITVGNAGQLTWTRGGNTPFRLVFQWYDAAGQMVQNLDLHTPLPSDVPPGGSVTLQAQLLTPPTPGMYHLRWDMIQEGVTWFTTQGDQGLLVSPVTIAAGATIPTTPATTPSLIQIEDISATLPQNTANPYPRRSQSAIRRIILHHSATPASVTPQRIAEYQVNNQGRPGIAYHYCIDAAGKAYQTQPLEVVSAHAGNYNEDSVGVCLIGNFSSEIPPQPQLDATAAVLAQVATQLGLTTDQIVGYSDLVVTGSPGATWPQWKGPLLAQVNQLMASGVSTTPPTTTAPPTTTTTPPTTTTPAAGKTIEHYMLLWHNSATDWAEWDLRGAIDYIGAFAPTVGFSIEEAKSAQYVTIVGGTGGVPASAEQTLLAAGCQVERLSGPTETDTRRELDQLVVQGKKYKSLRS